MPSAKSAPAKKQPLTLSQLSSYDDILTDALVDHVYYWTTVPKNKPSYHASRGIREEEIAKIVQSELVMNKDVNAAEKKLLETPGLRKFCAGLRTEKEKLDFKSHMRRYLFMYLPECPFEVSSTNRYTIVTHEAAITARRFIRRNETIKYLAGTQVVITPDEEREMTARKKDFSIIVSSRSKSSSLFMGPARFANHDCNANAKLVTTGQAGIEIIATTNIDVGEEITVTYSDNYFGIDNCECLCSTCEKREANGWATEQGVTPVKMSIEDEDASEGYSLRRKRRADSIDRPSRTPSVSAEMRPRVSRSRPSRRSCTHAEFHGSPRKEAPMPSSASKRKAPHEPTMMSPPFTPSKRTKLAQSLSAESPLDSKVSRSSSAQSSRCDSVLSVDGGSSTDITEPEKDTPEPTVHSPQPTRVSKQIPLLKQEDSEITTQHVLAGAPNFPPASPARNTIVAAMPVPTVEPVTDPSPIVARAEPETQSDVAPASKPKPQSANRKREFLKELTPPARRREPGDYSLTPLLLSEPEMAWIRCLLCDTAFVQHDAYYTKSSCPRCERHSKLYGYIWPKTDKEGPRDKEERILDHRTIHRFLTTEDEARIRGHKRSATSDVDPGELGRSKRQRTSAEGDDDGSAPVRRSGRARRVSSKIAGM